MAIANPALNEKVFDKEMGADARPAGPRPAAPARPRGCRGSAPSPTSGLPPARRDPASVRDHRRHQDHDPRRHLHRHAGAVRAAAGAAAGWAGSNVTETKVTTTDAVTGQPITQYSIHFPSWIWPVMLGAFVLAIVTIFKPKLARITAPIYARGRRLRARRHLAHVQPPVRRHRPPGRAGHPVGVRGDAVPLRHAPHQGHQDVRAASWCSAMLGIFVLYLVSFIATLFGADVHVLERADAARHRHQSWSS